MEVERRRVGPDTLMAMAERDGKTGDSPWQGPGLEEFVRHELGCACPPAVFDRVQVMPAPAALAGSGRRRLVAIGGRLLLLIVETDDPSHRRSEVEALLNAGRSLREALGFNRFRLVLAAPAIETDTTRGPLADGCRKPLEVDLPDDRTFLHIIPLERLPNLETWPEGHR